MTTIRAITTAQVRAYDLEGLPALVVELDKTAVYQSDRDLKWHALPYHSVRGWRVVYDVANRENDRQGQLLLDSLADSWVLLRIAVLEPNADGEDEYVAIEGNQPVTVQVVELREVDFHGRRAGRSEEHAAEDEQCPGSGMIMRTGGEWPCPMCGRTVVAGAGMDRHEPKLNQHKIRA